MKALDTQTQIQELNNKLDFILEEIKLQKQKRQSSEDLFNDLSIIGKDFFNNTIKKFDNAGIELDYEALEQFSLRFIKNIKTFNELLGLIDSINDFAKDIAPIIKQIGLDLACKLNDLEQKGYIDFGKELLKVFDKIITGFSKEDIRLLADNVGNIIETFKNMNKANIPEYSLWKAFRVMNSKDGKKAIGFILTFLQNISSEKEIKN